MATQSAPLIFGFAVNENNEVQKLEWADLAGGLSRWKDGRVWLHLNRLVPESKVWVQNVFKADPIIVDALFREDTRPRSFQHEAGWLINLRGVNFNDAPQKETMIALRMWVTDFVVISTRAYKIKAAEDLAQTFLDGAPPVSNGHLVAHLANRLVARIEPAIDALSDSVDELDERLAGENAQISKSELAETRRKAISLRRYMLPQKEALNVLFLENGPVFDDASRREIRETNDALIRLTEDLESVRDRAQIVQDQVTELRAENMNQRLFILAIISAIFLPLGFVTGLFGVNVGGMPGVDSNWAFGALCGGLVGLSVGLILLFRRTGWM